MHIKKAALTGAAALLVGAAADFLVITAYPQALQTLSPDQANSWIQSNLPSIQAEFASLATDPTYLAQATSVIPALREFAATATISVPPVVTAIDELTIFTAVPTWYSDLPSGVRSFYDDVARRVETYLRDNVRLNATASVPQSGSWNGALLSPTPSVSSPAEHTGAAGRMGGGVVGVGVAVGVAVGVFM